jgi:predicted amidophosphoribosyltransferase
MKEAAGVRMISMCRDCGRVLARAGGRCPECARRAAAAGQRRDVIRRQPRRIDER